LYFYGVLAFQPVEMIDYLTVIIATMTRDFA